MDSAFLLLMAGTMFCLFIALAVFTLRELRTGTAAYKKILCRLKEIEDTRPVNKINIVGDPAVPKGQAYALNSDDLKRFR